MVGDQDARAEVLRTAWRLAVDVLAALAAEFLAARLLRRVVRALMSRAPADPLPALEGLAEAEAGQTERLPIRLTAMALLRRLPFVIGRLVLEVLPILVFAAVGYGLLGTPLGAADTTRLVILAVLDAYIISRFVVTATRALVAPTARGLRLLPLSDESAAYIVRWVGRITVIGSFGYAVAEVGLLFGLYRVAHDSLLKLVVLAVHVCLMIVVLQQRRAIADLTRGRHDATGPMATMRRRAGAVWHIVAIFYLAALWLVWAFEVPDGFTRLIRVCVATAVVGVVGRLLLIGARNALDRALTFDAATMARYPGLEAKAGRYKPLLRATIDGVIVAAALIALFQAWGLDSISWFGSGALGGRVVSALITIGVTVFLSLLAWELANTTAQQHLERLSREQQSMRAARMRTLMPMYRSVLMVSIFLVAGLTILSEIGVNIAPLLAGAGVIGLAIGFGSQKLVQDIITGLFLLLENTMQVGDVVSLGGLSGTVENLSVRTIRLRALDGSVHIVPFSAVTTVTNMTRDYGYAVLDIIVGLNEDPAAVAEVVRDVANRLREEPRWASAIRDDLEVMGVDKFLPNSWVLRARIRTTPGQRWAVGRELNERIKRRFDAMAIESPMTSFRALGMDPLVFPFPPRSRPDDPAPA